MNDSDDTLIIHQVRIPKMFVPFAQDALKLFVIWAMYYAMMMSKGNSSVDTTVAVEQVIYGILGLATYWLILRRMIEIRPKNI